MKLTLVWKVMRITASLILFFALHLSAKTTAQNITMSSSDITVEQFFSQLEKQTGYSFLFETGIVSRNQKINVHVNNEPLEKVLSDILTPISLSFKIDEKIVYIIKATPDIPQTATPATPPPIDIHGHVTDSLGNPLAGATITIKSKNKSVATTNEKGDFELKNVDPGQIIVISYTGFEPRQIKWQNETSLNIVLQHNNSPLDQIQVIAYGTQTKRFAVGSVYTVTSKEIESQPVTNVLQALEGRVPGLVVSQTSGVPGSTVNLQIRGQNSLNTTLRDPAPLDNPFFIIDGVPFAPQNTNLNQFSSLAAPGRTGQINNAYGGMSPFGNLNPADIERIEILRDADATAIYGSRGANGVILITTKKGKAGKTKFNTNAWTGASVVAHTMPMMNTPQYLQMRNEAQRNDGIPPDIDNSPDLLVFDTTSYTDWKKYFIGGTSHNTSVNSTLSGGSANTQFFVGAGYNRESYIYPGDFSDQRASFNASFHHHSTDQRLSLDFSALYGYDVNNSSGSPNALTAFTLPPDYPNLLNADGSINWNYNGYELFKNPMSYLRKTYQLQSYNLLSNFVISYQPFKGFFIRSSFGYNKLNANEHGTNPSTSFDPLIYDPVSAYTSANFGTNQFETWIIEPQLEYKKDLGKGKLNLLAGGTFQQNTNSSTNIQASGYTNDALLGSIAAASRIRSVSDGYSLYKYSAGFARLNYIYDSKYILSLNARRDGSSRFGPGRQFGNFWSVGGGWIFSEEAFAKNALSFLSYGKLRASYGTTGNDNIGNYQYTANWGPASYTYQNSRGYYPQNLYQPDFSWTVNKKLEIGLELGFANDRLLTSISYYRNRSDNQLVTYNLPIQTGFSGVTQNFPALVQNDGIEIQLSSVNIKTNNFSWSTGLNISIPRNKLVSYPGIETSSYASTYIVGQSLNVLRKVRYAGVNDTTGNFQFYDYKGDLTYTPSAGTDLVNIGNTDPKFYGGLMNSFVYKTFQLDIFFDFKKQTGANYFNQIYQVPVGSVNNNVPAALESRWQKPGDHSAFQQFTTLSNGTNFITISSAAYSDASFIRLKTLSFSYGLPASLIKKINMESCRFYLNAQNLFTITGYEGNDPENQSLYTLPPLRTIVLGIQFTF